MADDLYVARYAFAEMVQVLDLPVILGALGFFLVLFVVFRRRGYM